MEPTSFDRLAKSIVGHGSRRSLIKGLVAGVAGMAGLRGTSMQAAGTASLTIHNASCDQELWGRQVYDACHANGFGCVDFFFRGRSIRTNAKGRATVTVGTGSLTIGQQKSRISKSRGIFVYCMDSVSKRTLFDGRADSGQVTITVKADERVVCDWYNFTSQSLALPQQCPGYVAPPTTTVPPTTTTTTTTPIPGCTGTQVQPGADTLQTAIELANSGDVLCLLPGTYYGLGAPSSYAWDIIDGKSLTIQGAGEGGTYLNCNGVTGGVKGTGQLHLSYLTVTNFEPTNVNNHYGAWLDSGGTISHVTFENGAHSGVVAFQGTTTMTGVTIKGFDGPALELPAGATVSLVGCRIEGNGGLYGTVYVNAGTLTADSQTVIRNNKSVMGGAFGVINGGSVTLNGTTVTGNRAKTTAGSDGGGAFYLDSGATLTNNGGTLVDNTAANFGGTGSISTGCTFSTTGGTISNNWASNGCPGVYQRSTGTCCRVGGLSSATCS